MFFYLFLRENYFDSPWLDISISVLYPLLLLLFGSFVTALLYSMPTSYKTLSDGLEHVVFAVDLAPNSGGYRDQGRIGMGCRLAPRRLVRSRRNSYDHIPIILLQARFKNRFVCRSVSILSLCSLSVFDDDF